ncbi:hypothetical protein [Oceaniradius stylonematis]|uniref:hypothetical protein n=1 Tax=Oceaniradius stylonematis TaxID=2184161 RepID=UPI00273F307A|nr:hypothetical protein [Oceaniradius stylonematis]
MPLGIDYFSFDEMFVSNDERMAWVKMRFSRDDTLNDGTDVSHNIDIRVRVNLHEGATIQELREAGLSAAVAELRHAL